MANSGRVTSSGTTISLAGAQSDLVNSGEILRMASGGTAVNMGGAARLDNLGRIVGNVITSNESDRIVNSGTIDGSVVTNDGNDTVNNTGLILGSMSLGNGNDRADLRGGRVTDFVSGGAGDDTFLVDDTPVILVETPNNGTDRVISVAQTFALPDNIETLVLLSAARVGVGNDQDNTITGTDLANTLSGGAGNDTIEGLGGDDRVEGGVGDDLIGGGAGADTILGGFGNDLATGGAGRDWAYGETGNDTIHGDEGDDFLFGGAGSDVLFGNTEDDALDGGADNDTLDGGAGNDTLTGGLGSDSLIGGPGRDVFRFLTTAESPNNVGRDIIALFTRGEDLIDLTALDGDPALGGNQPLSFIGTAPLTGPGQVRVLMVGADAYVQVNTIGVAPAEMMIFVRGPGLLEASDFLL
jgi:Ca2+-binding RTX toxin-like protein